MRPRPPLSLLILLLVALGLAAPSTGAVDSKSVTGFVRTTAGRPLARAVVRVQSGPIFRTAVTGANGEYALTDLVVGVYVLQGLKAGYQPVPHGVTLTKTNQPTVDFSLAWASPDTGGVEVSVLDPGGQPVEAAEVELARERTVITRLPTDDLGSISFIGLTPGVYSVRIAAGGFFPVGRNGIRVRVGGSTLVAARLRRDPAQVGAIAGVVEDLSGQRVGGAWVRTVLGTVTRSARSNAAGEYRVERLPASAAYTVECSAAGFETQEMARVRVLPLADTPLDFRLLARVEGAGSIAGTLRDPTGAPVPQARLDVTLGPGQGRTAFSGADGRYVLADMPPGTGYGIQASAAGFSASGMTGLEIRRGRTTTLDFVLQAALVLPGSIAGTTLDDETSAPLDDVLVEVLEGPSAGLHALSGANGLYLLPEIVPGVNYVLGFTRAGYVGARRAQLVVASNARTTVDARLTPTPPEPGRITGRVTELRGQAQSGARVVLFAGPGTPVEARTNAAGRFSFGNLTAGTYSLRVTKDGFTPLERTGLQVVAGGRVALELEIRRGVSTGELSGQVLDFAVRPVADAAVRSVEGPATLPVVRTDASGRFSFGQVPAGTYTLQVTSSGFRTLNRSGVIVSAGGTTNLTLTLVP